MNAGSSVRAGGCMHQRGSMKTMQLGSSSGLQAKARHVQVAAPVSASVFHGLPGVAAAHRQRLAPTCAAAGGRSMRPIVVAAAATLEAVAEPPAASASVDFPVPRGDTAGAALVVENVTVQAGDRDLLQDVSWRLMAGQRVGLVGANGAGKSTLLKALCGLQSAASGRVIVAPKVALGYLEQTAVSGSEATVWEEARSRMTALIAAEKQMEEAGAAADAGDPRAGELLAAAQEAYEAADGYEADRKIGNVLRGLGFMPEMWDRPSSEFSGGWQMRIALARLLLGPAGQAASSGVSGGLLLLDEPTNHLDSAATKWLASFLRSSSGAVVLVSHDESLLEGACDRIVEVRGKKLHHYVGSYSKFLELRKERETQALATASAQAAEIARLEEFVARFGAKASKASQAQSRQKLLEKLRDSAIEMPSPSSGEGPGDAKKVTLALPKAPPCFTDVLTLQGMSVGWGSPDSGAPPLLKGIDLVVKKGQRILVLGPNGAGKSTLLKVLSGAIAPWSGSLKLGDGAKLAVFSQDLAQDLPLDMPALDYVMQKAREDDPKVTMEKCRQALGALGLQGNMALQQIGTLSGGEKARVALAVFALVPANVLLLDEASNHLDAQTITTLTGALQGFSGAIVAITHNASFAASLNATHLLRVAEGTAKLSDNFGLTAADFEHTPKKASGATGGRKGRSRAGSAASSMEESMDEDSSRARSNGAASSSKPAASANAKGNGAASAKGNASKTDGSSNGKGSAAAAKGGKKRTTLAYKEQLEYAALCKELEKLNAKRAEFEGEVARLASQGSGGLAQLQVASTKLADVAGVIEDKELRWLELAELAGDL